ncbi:MAG: hypothetical protein R3C31_12100 [Hyphomonadaceae bacterium]
MLKKVFALAAALALVGTLGVAEARPRRAQHIESIPANSRVLVMTPDVQLSLLTAAGLPEPREDWSVSGRDNLATGLAAALEREQHAPNALDPATAMEGRIGQIIRLHDAVGGAILSNRLLKLPTIERDHEWTLGDGVQELATTYQADYALFTVARGSYASGARAAAAIVGLVAGVYIPMGGQQVFASLVDLRTGEIVWFGFVTAGGNDMREGDGANALIAELLRDAPL